MKPFVVQLDLSLAKKLQEDLKERGFVFSKPAYSLFSAKRPGLSCTLYASGKLVVQGRESAEFLSFYIEPELTGVKEADRRARIGSDETGKGDFFGPLCVAAVYVGESSFSLLERLGIRDSKTMSEKEILRAAKEIERGFPCHVVRINPLKYNELYSRFQNLNTLLAWAHATAIEALAKETGCRRVIVDQFAHESVLSRALEKKQVQLDLVQRPRGEEDPVVAAASILARKTFVEALKELEARYGARLPKGASSQTVAAGREFVRLFGGERLKEVAKMHFKTARQVL